MDKLVIANMVAMIGCVLMVAVGFLQKKRHHLQQAVYHLSW